MTNLGGRSRLLLPIAAVLLLLASGCGSKPVVPSTRADVTAAPPSSWGDQATADKKASKKKKSEAAASGRGTKQKAWAQLRDTSGISFRLPTAASPVTQDTPLPNGASMHSRLYTSHSAEGFEMDAGFQVFDGTGALGNLSLIAESFVQKLHAQGAPDARVEKSTTVAVAGHPGMDSTISFTTTQGGGRKICRLRAVLDGRMLVSTETIGYAAHDSAALRSRIGALQGRLNRSMRLS
jgi:hypothetical protein